MRTAHGVCLLQRSNGSLQNASRFLGYSGGAVPDSHRVPCSSAAKNSATDHQRTLTARNLTRLNDLVKRPGADCRKLHQNAYFTIVAFDLGTHCSGTLDPMNARIKTNWFGARSASKG
jgi:hypothetical protein